MSQDGCSRPQATLGLDSPGPHRGLGMCTHKATEHRALWDTDHVPQRGTRDLQAGAGRPPLQRDRQNQPWCTGTDLSHALPGLWPQGLLCGHRQGRTPVPGCPGPGSVQISPAGHPPSSLPGLVCLQARPPPLDCAQHTPSFLQGSDLPFLKKGPEEEAEVGLWDSQTHAFPTVS